MKLSKRTIEILKNFSGINQNMMFRKGNVLTTVSSCSNIVARAVLEENFPIECGIANLTSFLSVVSLFKEPDFLFGERNVKISDSNSTVTFGYANPKTLVFFDKKIKLPDEEVSFKLEEHDLQKILRASDSMALDNIIIRGKDGNIEIVCVNKKDPSSNYYSLNIRKDIDNEFEHKFSRKYFNILTLPYDVSIHSNENYSMCVFKYEDELSYYIMQDYED